MKDARKGRESGGEEEWTGMKLWEGVEHWVGRVARETRGRIPSLNSDLTARASPKNKRN